MGHYGLQYRFMGEGRQLVLVPNLRAGWRFHTKTACFCESVAIDSMDDRRVTVRLGLFPRPGLPEPERAADWLPKLRDVSGPQRHYYTYAENPVPAYEPVGYQAIDGEFEVSIDLLGDNDGFNPELPWAPNPSGKPQLFWQEPELLAAEWLRSAEGDSRAAAARCSEDGTPPTYLWDRRVSCSFNCW